MPVRNGGSLAGAVETPRLFWRVAAYDRNALLLRATLERSLTAAYRQRDALLRDAAIVVVEVVG